MERGEARIFAQNFQPVRFALVKGYKLADLKGLRFHGWVPSMVFYGIAEALLPKAPKDELIRIISTVQYPASREFSEEVGPPPLHSAVQVLKVMRDQGLYFIRVIPILHISDTDFNVTDGSRFAAGLW